MLSLQRWTGNPNHNNEVNDFEPQQFTGEASIAVSTQDSHGLPGNGQLQLFESMEDTREDTQNAALFGSYGLCRSQPVRNWAFIESNALL